MEDMIQCVTDANERKYGLWSLKDENTASRKCKCCGIDFYYPINKSILIQIKKQHQALKLLESFLNLSFDNPNFIGYLNVILEDVVDYIEDTETFQPKTLLDKKLAEVSFTSFVNEENKLLIERFRDAIKLEDNDLFFDTMKYFQEYNIESLSYFVCEQSKRTSNLH